MEKIRRKKRKKKKKECFGIYSSRANKGMQMYCFLFSFFLIEDEIETELYN